MADGYTHDPDAFDEDGERVGSPEDGEPVGSPEDAVSEAPVGDTGEPDTASGSSTRPETADREFDWRGWVLVAGIAVCFLVIPGVILAYPYVGQQLGLSFYDTYLALPMIPAVVLALLAVWATTRP